MSDDQVNDMNSRSNGVPKPFPRGAKIFYSIVAVIAIIIQWPQPNMDLEPYVPYMSNGYDASLKGTTVVITGATGGIGRDMALRLVSMGAHVIALGRSPSKLKSLEMDADGNEGICTTIIADLSDLDHMAAASKKITKTVKRIDFLINNAGILEFAISRDAKSKQGYSMVFAVNYLSHFLFTKKMLPLLCKSKRDSPRIIQVSSIYHTSSDGTDLFTSSGEQNPIASMTNTLGYGNTKLAQILHARALRRQKEMQKKVQIVSICPSWVGTNISGNDFGAYYMKLFGFRSDGFGLAGLFHAMYHPDAGKSEETDFITTNAFLPKVAKLIPAIVENKLVSTLNLRPHLGHVMGQIMLFAQRFLSGLYFSETSIEAYDVALQDNLYQWSENEVSPWMKK